MTLDTWLPKQVAFMARTGNAVANAHREARLDPALKPPTQSPDLEAFIRRKVSQCASRDGVNKHMRGDQVYWQKWRACRVLSLGVSPGVWTQAVSSGSCSKSPCTALLHF